MTGRRMTVAAQCMTVDRCTAEVVDALRARAIEPLLLKGPATARWLYSEEEVGSRPYSDTDLLVAPDDWHRTRHTLESLGFECAVPITLKAPLAKRRHAENWCRAADDAMVDLHASVYCTEHLDPQRVWTVLSRSPERITVAGTEACIPSEPVRALHIALHLRPHEGPGAQAWRDLERAIDQIAGGVWVQAADAARELDIEGEFGTALARLTAGRRLAEQLEIPTDSPEVLEPLRWQAEDSVARRLVRSVFPSPTYVRMGWPMARRGPVLLAAAYVWRLLIVPWRPVLWWRTRRASR